MNFPGLLSMKATGIRSQASSCQVINKQDALSIKKKKKKKKNDVMTLPAEDWILNVLGRGELYPVNGLLNQQIKV